MARDKADISSQWSPQTIQLFAIADELNSLLGQDRTTVARHLFTALVRTCGVKSGRIFLTDEMGNPDYCLVLVNDQLQEYDSSTPPPFHEQALAGWTYHQRRGVVIGDTDSDPRWASWAEVPEAATVRSALAVPILVLGQPVGALALISEHPHHFSETDLTVITNLTDQAATTIGYARLTALLSQKEKAIRVLQRTTRNVSTATNLDQLLRDILRQLMHAVDYPCGMILLQEGERLRPATVLGLADAEKYEQRTFSQSEIPTVFHTLAQGHSIITGDKEDIMDLVVLAFPRPIRTWAIAPLVARRATLGGIVLASSEVLSRDDQNISKINAFADHAAIAVSINRLAQDKDRRVRELAFLSETGQAITSILDLDRILSLLLKRVRELLQIDAVSIALRDEHTDDLVFEAASGEGASDVVGTRLKPGQGIAGWVAETGKPLVVQDAYRDARFYAEVDETTQMTTQAILCIPIVLKGRVVGVIEALNPREDPFDEQAIELLNALSGLAATAIDNARLFAQVRSAEDRYVSLFEDSANPIIITDLNGIIFEANRNACALLGQSKDALHGTNLTQLRAAGGSLDFVEPLQSIQTDQEVSFHTAIVSNGQRTTVEIHGKQVQVNSTALVQWIGRDISAEIELARTREDMVRMLIHDLRNPLSNIMNSLAVLKDVIAEKDDSVSQEELLQIARRSGQRMHQLISSILDISRLETGQAILETSPTDLVALIYEALEFIKPQTDIREIHISEDFAVELPLVHVDKDMILRVVLNLLDNACKFTQIDGTIRLSASAGAATVEVAVADNGPGIPPDQLQSIFKKFTRVRRQEGPKGTGLGLAFCKLAIEAHGGHIWAESITGQGSTFRFTLPTPPLLQPEDQVT